MNIEAITTIVNNDQFSKETKEQMIITILSQDIDAFKLIVQLKEKEDIENKRLIKEMNSFLNMIDVHCDSNKRFFDHTTIQRRLDIFFANHKDKSTEVSYTFNQESDERFKRRMVRNAKKIKESEFSHISNEAFLNTCRDFLKQDV